MRHRKILTPLFAVGCLIFLGVSFWVRRGSKTETYQLTTEWEAGGLYFKARETSPMDWKTDLYLKGERRPRLSLGGYYLGSRSEDIGTGVPYLEVSLLQGQLASFHMFKYISRQLEEIPFFGADGKRLSGIWSSLDPEYKDINGDHIKEMLVYHPHYPLGEMQTVEVYRYTGQVFQKEGEYEENTENL